MRYFVIYPDGNRYGPVDLASLNQWSVENRLSAQMMLEEEGTGTQILAGDLPGLMFPQAAAPQPQPQSQMQETSYQGYTRPGQYLNDGLLPEHYRKKFNWGAFFWNWIWGLNHKAYITLAVLGIAILNTLLGLVKNEAIMILSALISLASFGLCIYFGIKGNEWAWASKRFSTPEEMWACQLRWGYWALGFLVVTCGLYLIAAVFLVSMFAGASGR